MSVEMKEYLRDSRRVSVSLIAIMPLLMAYEIGILLTGSNVENSAGLLVKRMVGLFGADAYLALTAGVAVTFLLALLVKSRGPARRFQLYGLLLIEAVIYAAVLAPLVHLIGSRLGVGLSAAAVSDDRLVTALLYVGAGVWEELVFRLVLLGGFVWLTVKRAGGNAVLFGVIGMLLSSVAFSLFHNVGDLGEPFETGRFLFRTIAGCILGGLYLLRGLGITVYTHAFYNLGLLFLSGA